MKIKYILIGKNNVKSGVSVGLLRLVLKEMDTVP